MNGPGRFMYFTGGVSRVAMELEHAAFIRYHVEKRSGERKGRLEKGHRHAEKLFCCSIWHPLRGNFDDLHPEYEVLDWRGQAYYCDFAWITPFMRLIIEVKGFGPHVRDMDRDKYCNELNRETFLTALGYHVISFSYDDIAHRPELCMTLLRIVISRYQTTGMPVSRTNVIEREIIRLACTLARPIRPIDIESHLSLNHRTAVRALQSLAAAGRLLAVKGAEGKHVVRYELHRSAYDIL
jgi:hypothetical protein